MSRKALRDEEPGLCARVRSQEDTMYIYVLVLVKRRASRTLYLLVVELRNLQ